jgi:ATP-dependent helicase/nuclease subunit B
MAACPFQHFARYGLRLAPRELAEVEPSHLGQLVHAALARLVAGVLEDGLDLAELDPADARRRARAALDAVTGPVLGRLPPGSGRGRLLLEAAGRDMALMAETMCAHARAGSFRPVRVEDDFGSPGAQPGPGTRGRIDRVDAAPTPDGRRCLRVVDYKTGRAAFSLRDFYDGLNLQPVLYLFAALGPDDVPGGFFLLPVRAELELTGGPQPDPPAPPRLSGLSPADRDLARLHESALDGGVTGVRWTQAGRPFAGARVATTEDFALLGQALRRRVADLAGRAAAGVVAPAPYGRAGDVACDRCDFLSVCGFDPGAGDRYRRLPSLSLPPPPEEGGRRGWDEIWAALRKEGADAGMDA